MLSSRINVCSCPSLAGVGTTKALTKVVSRSTVIRGLSNWALSSTALYSKTSLFIRRTSVSSCESSRSNLSDSWSFVSLSKILSLSSSLVSKGFSISSFIHSLCCLVPCISVKDTSSIFLTSSREIHAPLVFKWCLVSFVVTSPPEAKVVEDEHCTVLVDVTSTFVSILCETSICSPCSPTSTISPRWVWLTLWLSLLSDSK